MTLATQIIRSQPDRWRRARAFLAVLALLVSGSGVPAAAMPTGGLDIAARHFEYPARVGSATFNYLFWTLYDAQLVAPGGVFRRDAPLMLTLTYKRDIAAADILDATVDELRRQGVNDEALLARWRGALTAIVPDIREGDRVAGVRDAAGRTTFYFNGTRAGRIEDARFGRHFFDIWLGPQSRDRRFTARLTGAAD